MFALLAFLCFLADLLGLSIGIPLVTLGLLFIAAHLMFGVPLVFWRSK
jgi:hypothetical protein